MKNKIDIGVWKAIFDLAGEKIPIGYFTNKVLAGKAYREQVKMLLV